MLHCTKKFLDRQPTVCPRSLNPFYIVDNCIKRGKPKFFTTKNATLTDVINCKIMLCMSILSSELHTRLRIRDL